MSTKKAKVEFSEGFKRAFHRTYGAIAGDVEDSLRGQRMSESLRRACMVESVLDANRMAMYGGADGKAADEELKRLIQLHDWRSVSKAAEVLL